jgi:hypothetical protein
MKKIYLSMGMVLLAIAFVTLDASAQVRYVDVDPGIGSLNDAISGDTTETGERIDPENTVYRLQRGEQAYYGLTGSISNSGYPLTIMAAEGEGARPFLQPRVVGDGSSRPFRPRGNITLKGLHVTAQDDLGGRTTRMLRCSADDIVVIVDDCWFDKDGQSFIRCDNAGMTFKITNTVVSNIGWPSDPPNGRVIDDRGNAIDTVIFENNTFYNITFTVIRDDGGELSYCRIKNNTFMNIGNQGIEFGPTSELELTNNLFVNTGFMPTSVTDPDYVFSIDSVGGVPPAITATNNNVYLDSTKVAGYLNDTLIMPIIADPTFLTYLITSGNIATMLNEPVEFTDGPPLNDSMIIYAQDPDLVQDDAPDWEEPEIPGDGLYHRDVPYDFGWVNSKLYVASTDGMQLGDRNWTADRDVMGLVDFENPRDIIFWNQFANAGDDPANMMIILNPDMSAANPSLFVMKFDVQDGADPWAGAFSDAQGYLTFTEEKHFMEMMVWKSVVSNSALKVEVGGTVTEVKVPNTVTNEWELLTFDFSANIGETLTRLVFFPDFPDERTSGTTVFVDNIQIVAGPSSVKQTDAGLLRAYPNPVIDQMVVEYPAMNRIVVRDILGKAVKTVDLQRVDQFTMPVDDLVEGMYFLSVEAEKGGSTVKFLKK